MLLVPAGSFGADGAEQQLAEKYAPVVGLKQHEPCARHRRALPAGAGRDGARAARRRAARSGRHGGEDGADRRRSVREGRRVLARLPGRSARCRLQLRGVVRPDRRGQADHGVRAHRRGAGEARAPVLVLLPVQRLEQQARERLGDDPARLRRRRRRRRRSARRPALVGYSQHEGAESATWDDEKLEKRDGHPVVYPGAGSHSNQFVQSLYLGHSAQTGFGCDDTRGPTHYEQTQVVLVPSEATGPDDPFAWLGYLGHWGQQVSGPNSGPTGPTFKGQWTKPITWVDEEWRSDNVKVPASNSVAPSATGFFCTAVAKGSEIYIRFLRNPFFVLGSPRGDRVVRRLALAPNELVARAARIRSGSGATPVRSTARGSACTAAGCALFLGIGLMAIPLGALAAIAQHLLFGVTGLTALTDVAADDPVIGALAALLFGALHHADRRHARVRRVRRGPRPDRRGRAARRARRLPRHRSGAASARLGDASHDDRRRRSWSSR